MAYLVDPRFDYANQLGYGLVNQQSYDQQREIYFRNKIQQLENENSMLRRQSIGPAQEIKEEPKKQDKKLLLLKE